MSCCCCRAHYGFEGALAVLHWLNSASPSFSNFCSSRTMPFLSLRGSKPKRLGIGHVPCVLFPSFLFLLRSFLLGCFSPWVGAEAPDSKQLPGSVKKNLRRRAASMGSPHSSLATFGDRDCVQSLSTMWFLLPLSPFHDVSGCAGLQRAARPRCHWSWRSVV